MGTNMAAIAYIAKLKIFSKCKQTNFRDRQKSNLQDK